MVGLDDRAGRQEESGVDYLDVLKSSEDGSAPLEGLDVVDDSVVLLERVIKSVYGKLADEGRTELVRDLVTRPDGLVKVRPTFTVTVYCFVAYYVEHDEPCQLMMYLRWDVGLCSCCNRVKRSFEPFIASTPRRLQIKMTCVTRLSTFMGV